MKKTKLLKKITKLLQLRFKNKKRIRRNRLNLKYKLIKNIKKLQIKFLVKNQFDKD